MAEEIGFENGRNSNFQGLVTLTLDPAIRHTVVHQSSTTTYIPNFIEIEETFCGRTDGRTFPPPLILLGRLLEVDLKSNFRIQKKLVFNYSNHFNVCSKSVCQLVPVKRSRNEVKGKKEFIPLCHC